MTRLVIGAIAIAVSACSNATSPNDHALQAGRYAISSNKAGNGTLTLTSATAQGVQGTWDLKFTSPRTGSVTGITQWGYFNDGAYVIWGTLKWSIAEHQFTTPLIFRVARAGSGYTCTVEEGPNPELKETCTMTYLGS